jgi:uncharacterized protein (UPF0332 family)
MKQQALTDDELRDLVAYRLQRAKETLPEADILMADGYYNAAVNRLYYACYYAVIALLAANRIPAQTHQGVRQMFSMHFILTKKIEPQYATFYSRLFNDWISGDYDDFVLYDSTICMTLRPQAAAFIQIIETELVAFQPE